MIYKRQDFFEFPTDSQQIAANLESAYFTQVSILKDLAAIPSSMFWSTRGDREYLLVKESPKQDGVSQGARSPQTEKKYNDYISSRTALQDRLAAIESVLKDRASLYRRMRLPTMLDRQAEILRKLDVESMLGTDLMVVGTNAFAAYELYCGARFPVGNEATEDFDMAWCRGTKVSMLGIGQRASSKTLFEVLKSIDPSYKINPQKLDQAVAADGYEVELLAAPSVHPLPKAESFEPMYTLQEQDWLLEGTPIASVVATVRGRVCPLYVPDPRWMALHKTWLSYKPKRKESKRQKDRRQGDVLLDAASLFLQDSHPLNVSFAMDLPEELRTHFDEWCKTREYTPANDL